MVPSRLLQWEHSPQGTTSEFWLRSSKTSNQRCVERPLALGMSAQPLALPGCCVLSCSSSRSDLMSSDVFARHGTSAFRNDLRVLDMELKNVIVRPFALGIISLSFCDHSFDWWRVFIPMFVFHCISHSTVRRCFMSPKKKETGHHVFKGTSALNRGITRKRKSKDTIHYNGDASNVELLYRIIHSANQLCVYGAVTNWCEESQHDYWRDQFFDKDTTSPCCFGEPSAPKNLVSRVTFTKRSTQIPLSENRILSSDWMRERYYVTLPDADDGLGNITPYVQRILSSSRTNYFQMFISFQSIYWDWFSLECICQNFVVFILVRYRVSQRLWKVTPLGCWYAQELKDLWMNCIPLTTKSTTLVRRCWRKIRKPVPDTQNSRSDIPDSIPYSIRRTDAYEDDSGSNVHLSEVDHFYMGKW